MRYIKKYGAFEVFLMKYFTFFFSIITLIFFQFTPLVGKETKEILPLKIYTERIERINMKISSEADFSKQEYNAFREELIQTMTSLKSLEKQLSERIKHSTPQVQLSLEKTLSHITEMYTLANSILTTIEQRKIQSNFRNYFKVKLLLYNIPTFNTAYRDGIKVTKDLSNRISQSAINLGEKSFNYPFYIYWLILLLLLICYIPLAILLRKKTTEPSKKVSFLNKIKAFLAYSFTGSIIPVLFVGFFFYIGYASKSFLFSVDEIISVYLVIAFIWISIETTSMFLHSKDFKWALVHVDKKTARRRSRRISLFLIFLALRIWLIQIKNPPEFSQYLELGTQILLSIQAFFLINVSQFRKPIKVLLSVLAIACPVLIFIGYGSLANLVLSGTLYTLLIYLVFSGISFTFKQVLVSAFQHSKSLFSFAKTSLENSKLSIYWTHTLFNVILFFPCFYLVVLAWGIDQSYLNSIISKAMFGFTIGKQTFSLIHLVSAVAVFIFLLLFTKYVQNLLKKRVFPYTRFDAGLKHALLATTGYIGFTIAIILSIKALGLNLSSLFYILGGLSVGIGLGLQPIVTNFISGLVMLVERPLKIGDCIELGGESGIVKKINVRTTEVENFEKCSVLYPNSQVINVMIKNWTKNDRVKRIEITVGVAYGCDTQLVEQILLKCAQASEAVSTTPAPYVVFNEFGGSSLNFTLRCYLADLSSIFSAGNAIRHEIVASLEAHGIPIPFPQTDIHFDNDFMSAFANKQK